MKATMPAATSSRIVRTSSNDAMPDSSTRARSAITASSAKAV